MTGQHKHRPSTLKQTNKTHKTGRHRSKGFINSMMKSKTTPKFVTKNTTAKLSKVVRRNKCEQLRKKKCDEVIASKRKFGGFSAPPILITIIPLHQDINCHKITSMITKSDDVTTLVSSTQGVIHISISSLKQRYSIIIPPVGNTFATLDAVKVSTTLLFVMASTNFSNKSLKYNMIDSWGEEIIETCISQGLPSTAVVLTDLDSINVKKRHEVKQISQSLVAKWLPEKISTLNNSDDVLNLLRKIGSQKQRNVAFRNKRPYLLADNVQYCNDDNQFGTLKVSGYLRGMPLSVNSIIHIPGFGDFQMSQIDAANDPYLVENSNNGKAINMLNTMIETVRILDQADPEKQENLDSENVPDPMDTEQIWPTVEEMALAEQDRLHKKIVKHIPKGTSEYQAAWLADNNEFSDGDYSDGDTENEDRMSIADAAIEDNNDINSVYDNEKYETLSPCESAIDDNRYDEQINVFEEMESKKKLRDAKFDAQFPDEVDTPEDVLAKIRFQKYRGLESFRTSPWDLKENLPYEYSRIFQFENFNSARKRILKENNVNDGILPGWYITLHVKNVNKTHFELFRTLEERPLVVIGLLANEQKMSLLNVVLKHKNDTHAVPIKSKEKLTFQCGFRRFSACPIFSEHTTGTKHKYSRYLQPNDTVVASMYAPITFPPCPVMCYKENNNGVLKLIATGSVLSIDPNRLIIKRAVLSGHPFKVYKRSAVIRFMFFHREDILWFRPIQLHTKYGRRGHIRAPLGTHGHMKCVFDGQLKSQDTILMNLYKRVFPKWTYEPYLLTSE